MKIPKIVWGEKKSLNGKAKLIKAYIGNERIGVIFEEIRGKKSLFKSHFLNVYVLHIPPLKNDKEAHKRYIEKRFTEFYKGLHKKGGIDDN